LAADPKVLAEKADLEEDTVADVRRILMREFEDGGQADKAQEAEEAPAEEAPEAEAEGENVEGENVEA
jgi:hypothetical protein